MTQAKLAQAEEAIINLADALGFSEQQIVKILEYGTQEISPSKGHLALEKTLFIEEMKSFFDCY